MISVGTLISPGSYCGFPAIQYALKSAITPFGARNTGGFCFAPTGSVAQVASAHCSNQPAGMKSAFLFSATPFSQRSLADSLVTLRYAGSGPSLPMGVVPLNSHIGAYCTRRLTLSLCSAVYMPMIPVPHDQPMRLILGTFRF